MADVTETVVARGRLGGTGLCYVVFEASPVSYNDTVTLSELSSITDVACFRLDTGASITSSKSGNEVTITQPGLSTVLIVGVATGY